MKTLKELKSRKEAWENAVSALAGYNVEFKFDEITAIVSYPTDCDCCVGATVRFATPNFETTLHDLDDPITTESYLLHGHFLRSTTLNHNVELSPELKTKYAEKLESIRQQILQQYNEA